MSHIDANRYDDAMFRAGGTSGPALRRDRLGFDERLYPTSDRECQSHVWLSLKRTLVTFAVVIALVVVLIVASY